MLPYPKQCLMAWDCGYLPVNGERFQAFQLFSFLMSGLLRHERQGSTFLVHILNLEHVYLSSESLCKLSNPTA